MVDLEPMRPVGAYEPDYCYYGDRPQWLVLYLQTRDSGALDRSNFRVLRADLLERFGEDAIAVEGFGHFAFGYGDKLLVNPACAEAVVAAEDWRQRLLDYPVASDDDFSALEWEETLDWMDEASRQAVADGHEAAPERWESDNGYEYYYTCARCSQAIVVNTDAQTWTVPECCIDDDDIDGEE